MFSQVHQYVDRHTQTVCTETFAGDRGMRFLYGTAREHSPTLFRLFTSHWGSRILAFSVFDANRLWCPSGGPSFLARRRHQLFECLSGPEEYQQLRKFFERKIRYWECRPMHPDPRAIVCPADSRVLLGSLGETSKLFLKEKFFTLDELLSPPKAQWREGLNKGDFAVFRLTPEKYHYNHVPCSGVVVDFYEIDGRHHSCNPSAVVAEATPYSKNRRVVTVIDTDVEDGAHVGLVAMVEIVALMIGQVVQCYSEVRYERPCPMSRGLFLRRGQPKSLFRPGSSTTVLLFQRGRIRFAEDLLENQKRTDVRSRFSPFLGRPAVETDVQVRSLLGRAAS